MVVLTFSRLLPQTPSPPRAALSRPARHVRGLIQIRSPPSWPPPLLSFAPVRRPLRSSAQENGGASETLEEEDAAAGEETSGKKKEDEKQAAAASATPSVPEEIKEMMEARKKSSPALDLWGGVAEEVREIEWPAFGKVLGTTGVVLAVIAGSSVALLTVNAILAELSDRVFAGRGLQDFFG
ncbi:preprotein translocase subunit SECE1 [Phoenix dactylifera]|uniref:Preprotein translocase subunit SECE1 n=1 Tax=Phoenix dactylifera TaxID=42345 RepID=A0A8B7CW93_PHODC|nr:preprotein translocase subunit SECE1 [Phoenix dactylifera]